MKEYSRRITGVMRSNSSYCYINDHAVEEMLAQMLGERDYFPATLSICITDLSEDTGAPEAATAPEEGGQD